MKVQIGLEVLLEDPYDHLESGVGLITNPSGVTSDLVSTIDAFHNHPRIKLKAIFGPEHGARGEVQDAIPVKSTVDKTTGLQIYSLYGYEKKPSPLMLEGIETLVFDIQDVGARFYTYASTLTHVLESASEQGLRVLVLDRPNPINGLNVEGPVLEPGFESFVGLHQIPIRHAFTIGELSLMINQGIGAELEVVRMEGWERRAWFDDTKLPWVMPSPNIPTLTTTIVYPGTCLFEGTNISEGRGTTRPFELIGAPWIDGEAWAEELNAISLSGVRFRACTFAPTFSKHAKEPCGGIQLHITNRRAFKPLESAIQMLSTVIHLWPQEFAWLPPSESNPCHFDLLAGTDKIRKALSQGDPVSEMLDDWEDGLNTFIEARGELLIYNG
jgi:uncharacterized protein YbbC (DUF1343 family)